MKKSVVERVALDDVLEDCHKLSKGLKIEDRTKDIGNHVTFEPNLNRPIHRWYKFKEGFSEELVRILITEFRPPSKSKTSFLDPFSGVGTSMLAAQKVFGELGFKDVKIRGIEINPYMHFVSRTKLDWGKYDPVFLMRAAAISTNGMALRKRPTVPALSTMRKEKYVDPAHLRRILELRDKVRVVARGKPEIRPLLLGLVAGTERIFNLRKDGRALRYAAREEVVNVDQEIEQSWNEIAEDLQLDGDISRGDWKLKRGDGRRADTIFSGEKFDSILFSPPYLNNIDYTEVYKIEQWLLEFIQSGDEMVAQRKKTFRSHPSCTFPEFQDAKSERVIRILGKPFERLLDFASTNEKWRRRLFTGYFADMLRTLESCRRLLKPEGRVFLVVGNSVHGTPEAPVPVAVDLWIAKLAVEAGLRVERILVGRQLPRRRMEWSGFRESILVMSKSS